MTVGIDEKGNIIEIYGLSTSSGGGGGTGAEYTAKNPISITNNKIGLKIDNQTLQINTEGQLVANLDELGNEVNSIAGNVATLQADILTKQDTLVSGTNIKTINNQSLLGSGNIAIEGGGATFTPTVYALNDTADGNINLDTVEVTSSASGAVTVQVCTLDVPSGWYIVTYKGLLDVPASNGGDKMTVFMQAYNTNTQEAKIQAMSGYITANTKNTYYLATTIMKIEENENITIGLQQFTNATRKNHTRGLVAMRIGDI